GIAGAARAAARFVVGQIRARARIVGLLGFPGHQAVLDVDLPAARTGAVHTMRGAHDLVVLPALTVAVLPAAVLAARGAVAPCERFGSRLEEVQAVEKVAHANLR